MFNVLFLIEDEIVISRLESVFNNDSEYLYYFFSKTGDAFELVRDIPVNIAFVYVDSTIMSGAEISDVLFDCNPDVKLIFVYKDSFIEEAIDLFNSYEDSQILNYNNCDPSNLRDIISYTADLLNAEKIYSKELSEHKEKEEFYKQKMGEISAILNVRLNCYQYVNKLLLKSLEQIWQSAKWDGCGIETFFEQEINKYIGLVLDRKTDFESFYIDFAARYHDVDKKRLFKLSNYIISENEDINCKIAFILSFICDAYLYFYEMYRGKIDMVEVNNSYQIDIIYDIRGGNNNEDVWNYVVGIIKKINDSICSKSIVAVRDGIMQYRLIFERQ